LLIAEYDKPYAATLNKLKNELAADEIDFMIEGEDRLVGEYDHLTFEIRVFIVVTKYEEANLIKMNIEDKLKRRL